MRTVHERSYDIIKEPGNLYQEWQQLEWPKPCFSFAGSLHQDVWGSSYQDSQAWPGYVSQIQISLSPSPIIWFDLINFMTWLLPSVVPHLDHIPWVCLYKYTNKQILLQSDSTFIQVDVFTINTQTLFRKKKSAVSLNMAFSGVHHSRLPPPHPARYSFVQIFFSGVFQKCTITGLPKSHEALLSLSGDDITSIQQEITMMKECKHKNIVAYLGTYHRCVPFISEPYWVELFHVFHLKVLLSYF